MSDYMNAGINGMVMVDGNNVNAASHCRKLEEHIAQLEEAGEEMANNLAFLANHLTGRIGEGAQAELLRLASEWYELVPETKRPEKC